MTTLRSDERPAAACAISPRHLKHKSAWPAPTCLVHMPDQEEAVAHLQQQAGAEDGLQPGSLQPSNGGAHAAGSADPETPPRAWQSAQPQAAMDGAVRWSGGNGTVNLQLSDADSRDALEHRALISSANATDGTPSLLLVPFTSQACS